MFSSMAWLFNKRAILFFFTGAPSFNQSLLLPHHYVGLNVRTDDSRRPHLSLLLYLSSEFALCLFPNGKAMWTQSEGLELTRICFCPPLAGPRRQPVPLPGCLRGIHVHSSEGTATRAGGKRWHLLWGQLRADQCTRATLRRQWPRRHHPRLSEGRWRYHLRYHYLFFFLFFFYIVWHLLLGHMY